MTPVYVDSSDTDPVPNEASGAWALPQRMFCKPLHNVGHFLLKATGCIYADKSTFLRASILKGMCNAARYHGVTAARCICPFIVDRASCEHTGVAAYEM